MFRSGKRTGNLLPTLAKPMTGTGKRHLAAQSLKGSVLQPNLSSDPTVLRAVEYKLFPKQRVRLPYDTNSSAALSLPIDDSELEQIHQDPTIFLHRSKELVVEHANRRVDLFFYTLIAYHNTQLEPALGHTTLQHGKGRNPTGHENLTQACHSSFTPSLIDATILKKSFADGPHKSILSSTHFMASLNSTVELPSFVNTLDDVLENNCLCRQNCIDILSKVALGHLNPIQGLTEFLIKMSEVLNKLKEDVDNAKHSILLDHSMFGKPNVSAKLIDLVIKGTFSTTFSEEKQVVSDKYIQSMLCLTPEEKNLCERGYKERQSVYNKKITDLQQIILVTSSDATQSPLIQPS
jgi:hypothetical protein